MHKSETITGMGLWRGAGSLPRSGAGAVLRLIDRRTGDTHRVNGAPVMVYSQTPAATEAALLSGRDRAVWEVRVEVIGVTL